VLGGTVFADRVTAVADERPNRHRCEHWVAALIRELGRRRHRHVGGADEANQSEISSAPAVTESPRFIVVPRDAQQPGDAPTGSGDRRRHVTEGN
jgi:hypothetical protein